MQFVTVLGSTGSIGRSTLSVIAHHRDAFHIFALTANRNVKLLYEQCLQFQPDYAVLMDELQVKPLEIRLKEAGCRTKVLTGKQALIDVAKDAKASIVVSAMVGASGLLPTFAAIKAGKRILLANKESLVMAGDIFMNAVREYQATLLPVDSEHNAIFQCLPADFLPGKTLSNVYSLILTASGGPFRKYSDEDLKTVTPMQAMNHPNWQMGPKISIDSATMMNKGLEVIEAFFLFGLDITKIRVVIHPQSIIHSLVEYQDGSLLAQLGTPDMRIPISHALAWPSRMASGAKRLDITQISRLDFEPPCVKRFPCLKLAYQAIATKGSAPAILNAANEIAVEAFCANKLKFLDIPNFIDHIMQAFAIEKISDLEALGALDLRVREFAQKMLVECQ